MADSHSSEFSLEHAALSDIGMRRANNQDSYSVVLAGSDERLHRVGHIFVVADGMGAHAAGELASRIAAEKIPHYYSRSDGTNARSALHQAISSANADIFRRAQENPEFHGMGTTASSLVVLPHAAWIGHVGDSRVYRLRGGSLEQLTFDHSLVWEMQASGQVRPGSQLSDAIPKNVITRSLGPNPDVQVDLEGPWPLQTDDTFLICSDGLSGQVTDEEIGALLSVLDPKTAVRVFTDLANLRGGPDNITVIIVKVRQSGDGAVYASSPSSPPRGAINAPLAVIALAALIGALILAVTGSLIPALGVLVVAALVAGYVWYEYQMEAPPVHPVRVEGGPARSSTSPYRRYPARPTIEMVEHLTDTVRQLRETAAQRRWRLEWSRIDEYERSAQLSLQNSRLDDALRNETSAILATMEQLRMQQQRAASDSTLDL